MRFRSRLQWRDRVGFSPNFPVGHRVEKTVSTYLLHEAVSGCSNLLSRKSLIAFAFVELAGAGVELPHQQGGTHSLFVVRHESI